MSDFNRDGLIRKYPALQHDPHISDPLVDQIEAGQRPIRPVHKAGKKTHDEPVQVGVRRFSPVARFLSRISAAIDSVREVRCTVADSRWYEEVAKLNCMHSNLPDRKALPYDKDGHKLNVVDLGYQSEVENYRLSLEASTKAPGGRSVVLVSASAPTFTPQLPWGWTDAGEVASSVVAFPVPHGFSTERVARLVLHSFPAPCHWCGIGRPERGLLVSADPTVYVFPTCLGCGYEFERDCNHAGLDFVANDGWDSGTGWPADDHR